MLTKFKTFKHFLLAAALLMISIGASAQINLSLKDVKVSDAITALNRAQGYSVSVNSGDLDLNRVVSVNASGASINEVLDQIFAGQQVTYRINGKSISVTKSENAAANAFVSGSIVDEAGEPLVGAGIRVKGSSAGFISDLNGNFTLKDVSYPATLIVSYIGYKDQEVSVNGKEGSIKVVFTNAMNMLDEVVVVGYGTQKRVNLTGAVSVIDGTTLNQRPVTNTAMALQGADPSLLLTTGNGSIEGSQYSLSVRGDVSINSGSPLVLVDGVEGNLSLINPNDIESISVLKDASACAIYGAKASAGVIMVNTKSGNGEEGRASINYNGRFSLSDNTTSTNFMTCAYDYITMTNSFNQVFQGNDAWTFTNEQIQMMYDRRNDVVEDPSRPWVIPDVTRTNTYLYLGNFDWYGYLFKRLRPETEHNVSIKGGTKKMNYYVSGRYLYREGLFNQGASDKVNNFSFRTKLNAEITPWLHYSSNLAFERSKYEYGGFWEQDGQSDLTEQGILWNTTQNVGPFYVPFNPDGTVNIQPGYMYGATSPLFSGRGGVWMNSDNKNARIKNALTLTNRLTFDIVTGLKFVVDYTYRRNDNVNTYRSLPTANCYDNANKRMYVGNGLTGGYFSNGSVYDFYREVRYYQDGHVANGYFSYDNSWGKNNFAATLGANFDDYRSSKVTVHQKGSLSDQLQYLDLASATEISTLAEANSAYRTLGFFGRINYNYAEKYLLELSGRYDGSSRFPAGHRWGFFPSASVGWRMSEEPFWGGIKNWWNKSKLRLSYGSLGNQQVSDYYYFDKISLSKLSGYSFNGTDAAQSASMSSPVSSSLTWETVISYNLGLDLGFFNDRLNISADAYIRDTKNMLTKAMTLPNVYGESAPKENAADLRTNGYEISVSWRDSFQAASKPFYYGITATLGDNITKITKFDNKDKLLTDNYVGKTLGEIWGYHVIGLFETDEEAAEWANQYDLTVVNKAELACKAPYNRVMAGDMKFANLDGDKHMKDGKMEISNGANTLDDPGDRKVIGNSIPRYRYSFRGDLNWNGIDFSIFFQGVGKCDWYPDANCVYFWGPYSYRRPTFIPTSLQGNCWSEENTSGYFPRQRAQLVKNSVVNDRYLQSAAYLRLKNLTLGYSIPFKTKAIQKFRVYFSGENLCYFSPMKKNCNTVDPEVATTSAYGDCLYPYARTFTFGVDITF